MSIWHQCKKYILYIEDRPTTDLSFRKIQMAMYLRKGHPSNPIHLMFGSRWDFRGRRFDQIQDGGKNLAPPPSWLSSYAYAAIATVTAVAIALTGILWLLLPLAVVLFHYVGRTVNTDLNICSIVITRERIIARWTSRKLANLSPVTGQWKQWRR